MDVLGTPKLTCILEGDQEAETRSESDKGKKPNVGGGVHEWHLGLFREIVEHLMAIL